MEKLLVRPEEAAEMLGVCRAKVFQLIASGRLQSVRVGGSRRIPADALRRFVDELLREQLGDGQENAAGGSRRRGSSSHTEREGVTAVE